MFNRSFELTYIDGCRISLETGFKMQRFVRTHFAWFDVILAELEVDHRECFNHQCQVLKEFLNGDFDVDPIPMTPVIHSVKVHSFTGRLGPPSWKAYWNIEAWESLNTLTKLLGCGILATACPKIDDEMPARFVTHSLDLMARRCLYDVARTMPELHWPGKDDSEGFASGELIEKLTSDLVPIVTRRVPDMVNDLRYRITSA